MEKDINKFIRTIYLFSESGSLLVAFALAHLLRGVSFSSTQQDKVFLYFGFFFWLIISSALGLRRLFYSAIDCFVATVKASVLFAVLISMVAFFLKEAQYSRLVVVYFVILHALFVYCIHSLGDSYVTVFHRRRSLLCRVCLVGDDECVAKIHAELEQHPEHGLFPVCSLSSDCLSDLDPLKSCLMERQINEVVVSCPHEKLLLLDGLVNLCDSLGVRVTILPEFSGMIHSTLTHTNFLSRPALRVRELPLDDYSRRALKRTFDVFFSLAVLTVLSPLFLVLSMLIKASSKGPVFFKQARTGYNQREFMMYKFRSMKVTDQADTLQATQDDPRKTWIGEFMRRTNIDELPQFINVLKGDMSIVGPRPHMLVHTDEFSAVVDGYLGRHFVRPGITGWAQVNGWRGPTDTEEKIRGRVEHDLWYVENWSFALDMKIIFLTVFGSKSRQNAF